ncbi:unnamed protein product, partial [Brassica oleracea]
VRSKRKGACTGTLLKGFFDRLGTQGRILRIWRGRGFHSAVHRSGHVRTQLEKQEGVEMVESNLDGIVGCVDYFPHMED